MDQDLREQLRDVLAAVRQILPKPVPPIDWSVTFAANWRRHTLAGYLEPMRNLDRIQLDDLLGIEAQKQVVENNTRQFIKGIPANNMLLWGSRGTGKSSLIRALLNRYASDGLRVVQIDKDDLPSLPDIFQQIESLPYRFILFCDDLSFEPGERSYKMLKSVLDGSVYAAPANALICVTSNRRHLLPEYQTDNLGAKMVNNEVHYGEGIEEKISLADRFGLWIAFHVFSQEHYCEVVNSCLTKLAVEHRTSVTWDRETEQAAIAWSHEKSQRCGRTAQQFARFWIGRLLLLQGPHGPTDS